MAKRTIKINIKLPVGVTATEELVKEATKAAKTVVDALSSDLAQAQKTARELAKQGFKVTAQDLLKSKTAKKAATAAKPKPAGKKSARTRIILTDGQKAAMAEELKKGMKLGAAAAKYGVSVATAMNVKKAAGLVRKK
jgi:hypothetical protein